MFKPLAGTRVLDLTNVLAGPFCSHQLVHTGAEVIKVEVAGRGDLARQLGADAELNLRSMGVSYLAQNAGKKSVTLNLKHPDGKRLFRRLVETALGHCRERAYLKIILDTDVNRAAAIALFEAFGFELTRTRDVDGRKLHDFYLNLYRDVSDQN